jgi:hypothetical protein
MVIITYLLTDCVKILLAKQKNKMTPTNIFKIKKGISIVLMILNVLITQGWFQKKKK